MNYTIINPPVFPHPRWYSLIISVHVYNICGEASWIAIIISLINSIQQLQVHQYRSQNTIAMRSTKLIYSQNNQQGEKNAQQAS